MPRRSSEVSALSEYELKRRHKMTENADFLQHLGVDRAQLDMKLQLQLPKQKRKSAKPKKAPAAPKTVRRSSRLRDAPTRAAAAERERRQEEQRKQQSKDAAAKKIRFWEARRKRRVAAAEAAAERSRRAASRNDRMAHSGRIHAKQQQFD